MAKFGSYYNLCPLTDIKGLQGISPDKESGQIIVTYRRNLAIKYKLHDQRQIHSWRTKETFGSPVVWCASLQKYFAVFGEHYVRCWGGDEEYLDKLKKHKFNVKIKTLVALSDGHCFMVFTNGTVLPLESAMSQRKSDFPTTDVRIGEVQEVMYCNFNKSIYIGMTISDENSFKFAWTSFDVDNYMESESGTFELNRSTASEDVRAVGSVITEVDGDACLLLLWSDGRLFQVDLRTVEIAPIEVYGEGFRAWTNSIAMVSLGDSQQHVAIFGEAVAGEGALLALYAVRMRRIGPTLALKVRGDSRGRGLWHCEGGQRLLVHVGQNLVVVPVQLAEQELAHLLGGDENSTDVDQAHVITHIDPSLRVVDLDEAVVVHLIQQALPDTREVLQIVSKAAVNDQTLIKVLRKHFPFTSAIQLLRHLCICLSDEVLEEDDAALAMTTSVKERCVMWATCLLDANFQQLSLASHDPAVKAVLDYCCSVLNAQILYLSTLRELNPYLQQLFKRSKNRQVINSPINMYSIEPLQLY